MDNSYYQSQLFDSTRILPEDNNKNSYYNSNKTPADGLVYNHLQQTLQVQTDLRNQQRVQEFLNTSAITEDDAILGFDELYSSVTSESDITYLQLMQQATPFYTPIDTASTLNNHSAYDFSSLTTSVAGLDTGCSTSASFLSSQHQHLLCHPLASFPDINIDLNNNDRIACDCYLNENDMLAGLNCNTTFNTNNCFSEMNSSTFIPPLLPCPSPSIHETVTSLSTITSSDHRMTYRSNSTPMLSASYSFSSFSSASSNEDDSVVEEETSPTTKLGPKKSASISFIPEKRRQKKSTNATTRKSSITKPRKFSKKNSGISSDTLSYYLSKQHLSDTEEFDEEYEENGLKMSSSASSGMLCKKGRNVDKACNHCKRSHLRCDNVRPCRRCVATGKVGCQDVKHKPRGRPRLQKRL